MQTLYHVLLLDHLRARTNSETVPCHLPYISSMRKREGARAIQKIYDSFSSSFYSLPVLYGASYALGGWLDVVMI